MPHSPVLKWAGGKRWLLPTIEPIYRQHQGRRLVEPFCGGMAISLGISPPEVLANDSNEHLINFYRWLQKGLQIYLRMKSDKELYYSHRSWFNKLVRDGDRDTSVAAQLFYYLNQSGFNGLCRFNQSGEFNVPFGGRKNIVYRTAFKEYKDAFLNWQFHCVDFEQVPIRDDDFVYADPPYDGTFKEYSTGKFDWEDQIRLAVWLTKHSGPVLLSNAATPRILELYRSLGYEIQLLDGPRRINPNGDRTPAPEVLASRGLMVFGRSDKKRRHTYTRGAGKG